MSDIIYNDSNCQELLAKAPMATFGSPGILPRLSAYGSGAADAFGLNAMEDDLTPVPEDSWKEVIEECHAKKLFPMYHREAQPLLEQKPSQKSLNFCWAWSARASLENCRQLEGQSPISLAPVSMAYLTRYRNQGFYLDVTINAMRTHGMASEAFCPEKWDYTGRSFKPGWEEDALRFRTMEWWDTNREAGEKAMIAQCLAILQAGRSLYWARNVESHATTGVGMWWDESQMWNIVWADLNSWADGVRKLAGNFGMPSEAYGVSAAGISSNESGLNKAA